MDVRHSRDTQKSKLPSSPRDYVSSVFKAISVSVEKDKGLPLAITPLIHIFQVCGAWPHHRRAVYLPS